MKKLFALLLAVVMMMGLVACATTPAESTPAGKDPENNSSSSSTVYEGVQFPLAEEKTFKITAHGEPWITEALGNNKLWQEIYQKTNVKIEINWITAANKDDRISQLNNMLQTNQVGDAVLCVFMDDASISSLVGNDQILAITEYVDNEILMPNLHKNVFGSEPGVRGNWTFPDGEVYVLGSYTPGIATDAMWYINKAWLDKAGMEVPTTWAEFEAALEYFAANDMNGNGDKTDEIPLFVHTSQNYSLPSHWMACWGISGKDSTTDSYTYIMDDGETVDYIPLTDNYKAMLTQFAEWYKEGILFDGFELDKIAVNEYYRGSADSVIGVMTYKSLPPRNADEYVMFCPPAAEGYELEVYNHPGVKYGQKNSFFLMKDCSDPETLLAWFDLFYDTDVSIRNKYGELDSVFVTLDENGKLAGAAAVDTDWFEANKKTDNYLGKLLQSLPSCYTQDTYDNVFSPSMSTAMNELKDMYGEHLNPTPWPRPYFSEDDSKMVAEVRADINTLTAQWYAEFVTGKKNIETDWNAWLEVMDKAGIDQYIEGHQNAYDNWLSGQK